MNDFYVYVYIDPRNFEEFYYGKGKGNRKESHLSKDDDKEKTKIIKEIMKEGLEPIIKVIARNLTQEEALLIEKTLIWKLGKNLANIATGHYADKFRPHDKLHLNLSGFDYENGLYYINVGEGEHRCWEDCKNYGFLSAGQDIKYSNPIRKLEVGDVVVAFLKRYGYVGIGKVAEKAVPVNEFYINNKSIRELDLKQPNIFKNSDNDNSEFLVKINWIESVDKSDAKWKKKSNLFATQQVRASLDNQPETVYFLEKEFQVKFSDILIENKGNQELVHEVKALKDKEFEKDRYLGCFLGGAIGDALGAPIEFLTYDEIQSKYGKDGINGFIELPDGKGEFTDDTQMTLFTAEGLLRAYHLGSEKGTTNGKINLIYNSHLRWLYTQGYEVPNKEKIEGFLDGWLIKRKELFKNRSAGNTCLSSLQTGRLGMFDKPLNDSKGCGTVMRIAPAGLIYSNTIESAFLNGVEISSLTHGHPSGFLSGGLLSAIIFEIASGVDLTNAIHNGLEQLKKWDNHEEVYRFASRAIDLHRKHMNKEISHVEINMLGKGWVAEEALAIALLCSLHYQNDFEKAVLQAVNHSGDSDSTGAITGNIVGLILGASKIPEKWKSNLLYSDIVEQIACDVFKKFEGEFGLATEEWATKYPRH